MAIPMSLKFQLFKERVPGFFARLTWKSYMKFFLVLIVLGFLVLFIYKVAFSLYTRPRNVMITNITSSSATISWVTEISSNGVVYYDLKDTFLPWFAGTLGHSIANDDRDVANAQLECIKKVKTEVEKNVSADFSVDLTNQDSCNEVTVTRMGNYYVHHVTLMNLNSEQIYHFRIGDAFWSWNLGQTEVKTFAVKDQIDSPKPIFGKVGSQDLQYSRDAIVYITFSHRGIPSQTYSSVTNEAGGWYLDGANITDASGKVIFMEAGDDMFDAIGVMENMGRSDTYTWIFGQFDGAFPDIIVGDNSLSQIMKLISFKVNAANCGSDPRGAGVCVKEIAASNNGIIDKSVLEKAGLCKTAVACAGNLSSLTGQGIRTADFEAAGGMENNVVAEAGKRGVKKKCSSGKKVELYEDCPVVVESQTNDSVIPEAKTGPLDDPGTPDVTSETKSAASSVPDTFTVETTGTGENKVVKYYANLNGQKVSLESLFDPTANSQEYSAVQKALQDTANSGTVEFKAVPLDIVNALKIDPIADPTAGAKVEKMKNNPLFVNLITAAIKAEENKAEYNSKIATQVESNFNANDWSKNTPIQVNSEYMKYVDNYVSAMDIEQGDTWKKVWGWIPGFAGLGAVVGGTTVTAAAGSVAPVVNTAVATTGGTAVVGGVTAGTVAMGAAVAATVAGLGTTSYAIGKIAILPGDSGCWGAPSALSGKCTLEDAKDALSKFPEFLKDHPDYLKEGYVPAIVDGGANGAQIVVIDMKKIQDQVGTSGANVTFLESQIEIIPTTSPSDGSFLPTFTFNSLAADTTQAATKTTASDGFIFFLPEYGYFSLELGDFSLGQQITDGKTIYLFYLEANGIDGLQVPKDLEHPVVGEDMIVKSAAYKIQLNQKATTKKYAIQKGINMVSFDFVPTLLNNEVFTAKDLVMVAAKEGIYLNFVTYFSNGRWVDGIKCTTPTECLGNDFPLTPGRGYLLTSTSKADLTIPAYTVKNSVPVSLYSGWNLVGIHGYTKTYTAKSLLESINSIETIKSDNVTWYPTAKSKYEGLQLVNSEVYGFDFKIDPMTGYFIRVNSITPEDKACKSVIWHEGGELNGKCGDSKSLF